MAGRPCTVCTHPDAPSVDMALVNHRPFRRIAAQFGLSLSAVIRHHDDHLAELLARGKDAQEMARADDLLAQVRALRDKSLDLLKAAEQAGDFRTALAGVREARACLELFAELSQAIDRRPTLNLLIAPEWLAMRFTLLEALAPYPDARSAVAARLVALEQPGVIADDLALALDPVLLARRLGMDPDPWQAEVLRSASPRLLLNCSRQSGKSTTVALLNVHTALYQPNSLCLMVSPSLRQSGELFKKAAGLYRDLGRPVPAASETALTVTLENGSRIVSLPGQDGTVRGYSGVRLLSIDEASRVPDGLYMAVRPMLAVSGGRLLAMSTPWGQRGWFFEAWRSDEAWERYEVPATECPRISAEFLDEERRAMGAWWYDQEYLCKFLDAEDAVFRRADIDAAFTDDIAPLFGAPPEGSYPWDSIPTPSA